MLSRWHCGTVAKLVDTVSSDTTYQVTENDVDELIQFLYANHLTQAPPRGGSASFVEQSNLHQQHWLSWIIHHYLFFKIPLVQPDRWLKMTLPYVSPFMTPTAGFMIATLGVLGLLMVSRQWETFTNTFLHMFTLEGMLAFMIALCVVKVLHELGHAYMATKYRCRVHSMGVAFLVMFPVLYTDTTDAWRLKSRKERLTIAAAGIIVELAVAMLATFLWTFLPDGILRSVAFCLATTSWIMSITINLNPFLRFDGYYFLSDWLGIPNLQHRAFALGRWKLREWLFGIGASPPESLTSMYRKILVGYAWCTWAFRFFLFLGIALLVYHFFFKVLGIILFVVEIVWFILLPIKHELKEWWDFRGQIRLNRRTWISATIVALLLILTCLPWNTRVSIPAILQVQEHTMIYTPVPARLVQIFMSNGQTVRKGDVLAKLESPKLEHDINQTQQRITTLKLQLARFADNPEQLADYPIALEDLKTRISELDGLLEMKEHLELRSPFSGLVVDLQSSLHPGRWVNEQVPLAHVIQPEDIEVLAVTTDTELQRLSVGQPAKFIPDDPLRPIHSAQIREIRHIDEKTLMVPYLASLFGGDIPVREDQEGNLFPESAVYRVVLDVNNHAFTNTQVIRGLIHIEGEPKSLLERIRDFTVTVLIREMGF